MRFLRLFFTLFSALIFSITADAKLAAGLYANLHTNQGDIMVKLAFEKTPLTVINFVGLAQGSKKSNQTIGTPFYDGLKFHRVIDNFMIQGGNPGYKSIDEIADLSPSQNTNDSGPGYQFVDEITDLKHNKPGILSMANAGKNTNGSQFFITHTATPWLDGEHTVFGEVVQGMSVVNAIQKDDFIQTIEIIRIGARAKNFKTDEKAFQTYQNALTPNH